MHANPSGYRVWTSLQSGRAKSKWTAEQKSTDVNAKPCRLEMESSYTAADCPGAEKGVGSLTDREAPEKPRTPEKWDLGQRQQTNSLLEEIFSDKTL